jgi:hypothetical protein
MAAEYDPFNTTPATWASNTLKQESILKSGEITYVFKGEKRKSKLTLYNRNDVISYLERNPSVAVLRAASKQAIQTDPKKRIVAVLSFWDQDPENHEQFINHVYIPLKLITNGEDFYIIFPHIKDIVTDISLNYESNNSFFNPLNEHVIEPGSSSGGGRRRKTKQSKKSRSKKSRSKKSQLKRKTHRRR